MEVTRPSIVRLARRAGVKSVSEECFPLIKALIGQRLEALLHDALILKSEHQTKTLMPEDIYEALSIQGEHLTPSDELATVTVGKK